MTREESLEHERDQARRYAEETLARLRDTEAALRRTQAELVRLDSALEAGEWMLPEWAAKQVLDLCDRHMRDQGGDYPAECRGCDTESDDIEYHPESCTIRRLAILVGGQATADAMAAAVAERAAQQERQRLANDAYLARRSALQVQVDEAERRMSEALARQTYGWVDFNGNLQPGRPPRNEVVVPAGPVSRLPRG